MRSSRLEDSGLLDSYLECLNSCGYWLGVWTLVGDGKVSNSIAGYNVARGLGCSYSRGLLSERWLRAVYDLDAFTLFLMAMIRYDQESGQLIRHIKTCLLVYDFGGLFHTSNISRIFFDP
jgi:hypothetical protein